jgi:hypothetical protein
MKNTILLLIVLSFVGFRHDADAQKQQIFALTVYQIHDKSQENRLDAYLGNALIPALHRNGMKQVGVFKPIKKDSANYGKKIYLLTTFPSLDEFKKLETRLNSDEAYKLSGSDYINALHNQPPYDRIEISLMQAFQDSPQLSIPDLRGPRSERIYELRSYEGPTEKLYRAKVKMFNTGDEIGLFKNLGFNAIFYGDVIAGKSMPNLLYMTTFENMSSRDEHWKAFFDHPHWKKLVTIDEYKNTVSKADIILLFPADYSDF